MTNVYTSAGGLSIYECCLAKRLFEHCRCVRAFVAILDDNRCVERDVLCCSKFPGRRTGAGNDDCAGWNDQLTFRSSSIDLLSDEVVSRGCPGQKDAWSKHRAFAHDDAFIDAAVPADKSLIFDDDGQRAGWFEDAPDLRGGRQVHALADLSARSYQRVRVHHRSFIDICSDVN